MENLSKKEMIKKTFDQMPRSFTSHEFVKKLIENGAERNRLYLYQYLNFLNNNCSRDSKKTWSKLPRTLSEHMEAHRNQFLTMSTVADFKRSELATTDQILDLIKSHEEEPVTTYSATISFEKKIEDAITLLKANGYKVQKIILQDV